MTPLDFVSLDIETLDNKSPTAAIATIGAVLVLDGKLTDSTFYERIDLDDSRQHGTVSADTLLWHIKQGEVSLRELTNPQRLPLVEALTALTNWLHNNESTHGRTLPIVTRDQDFDLSILADKYHRLKMPVPWRYYFARSHRTRAEDMEWIMRLLGGQWEQDYHTAHPVSHHALADATNQAQYLCTMIEEIKHLAAPKTSLTENAAL